jgi:hypothetical protein
VVASVQEALEDVHFKARGLFNRRLTNPEGESMMALPVPVADLFRSEKWDDTFPTLGESNGKY